MNDALSPEQARQQLNEAAERAELSRTDAAVGALTTGGGVLLLAATLAAVTFFRGSPVGFGISMGVYVVALALLLGWFSKRFRISDRSWRRRYFWGFGLTMMMYLAGILWETLAFPGWAVFAPYCVLVAVPGLVAAGWMLRR